MKDKFKLGDLIYSLSPLGLDRWGNWDMIYGIVSGIQEEEYKVYWIKTNTYTYEKKHHIHEVEKK